MKKEVFIFLIGAYGCTYGVMVPLSVATRTAFPVSKICDFCIEYT